MHGGKLIKQDLVREWRVKYPNIPSTKLSRIIYNSDNNHLVFRNSENIRTILRHIEGKTGDKNRKTMKDKSLFLEEARPMNPYTLNLPEGDFEGHPVHQITGKKVLVLSDVHVPYHDAKSLEAAILYGKEQGVDTVLLNGDFIDCYSISRFERDIKARNMAEEIEMVCEILRIIEKELKCHTIYKVGNHCARVSIFLNQKFLEMPQLAPLHEFRQLTLETFLRNRLDFKFDFVESKQFMNFYGLTVLHGHELTGGATSPINPAKAALAKTGASVLIGHHHTFSNHFEKDIHGNFKEAYSLGCLTTLTPNFMPVNKHSTGFCILEKVGDSFKVHNKIIIKGVIQ